MFVSGGKKRRMSKKSGKGVSRRGASHRVGGKKKVSKKASKSKKSKKVAKKSSKSRRH